MTKARNDKATEPGHEESAFAAAVADAARAIDGAKEAPDAEQGAAPAAGEAAAQEAAPSGAETPAPRADDNGQARVAQLERELAAMKDRMLRTAADFENWKRRTKKEAEEAASSGREALVKEILPVLDNLERALKHATADDPLATGIRLVEKQLIQALEKFGIKRFASLGEVFDPSVHEAIQHQETDRYPPGAVAEEFSAGYTVNGRLLRAAMVAVAKAPAATESVQDTGEGGQ